jgi:predicted HicB family RNase H-like nuclease
MTDIALHGSLFVGPYKGYHGLAEYDSDAAMFHGEVTDTKDVITFVADEPAALKQAFKDSIDDYLAFCKSRGEAPEKPYSGKFLVRATPKLHRALHIAAVSRGKGLNEFVIEALANTVADESTVTYGQQFVVDVAGLTSVSLTDPDFSLSTTPYKIENVPLGGTLKDFAVSMPRLQRTGTRG